MIAIYTIFVYDEAKELLKNLITSYLPVMQEGVYYKGSYKKGGVRKYLNK